MNYVANLIAVYLLLSKYVFGFNIGLVSLVRSPIGDKLTSCNTTESDGYSPTFFGYSVKIQTKKINKTQKLKMLYVGAPHAYDNDWENQRGKSHLIPAQAKGRVVECPLSENLESVKFQNCGDIMPDTSPGDALGLNIAYHGGKQLICSPNHLTPCAGFKQIPGYCYRRGRQGVRDDPINHRFRTEHCMSKDRYLDLIFVLDGSDSVKVDNFELVKTWVVNVTDHFSIESNSTQVGVVQYSHFYLGNYTWKHQQYIKTEIPLATQTSRRSFRRSMAKIKYMAFSTWTAHALNKTVMDFQTSRRFNDPKTAKVLILLTDGNSNDASNLTQTAEYVRSLGIVTFAVGVAEANIKELQIIANGKGTNERVYQVDDFNNLTEIVERLQSEINYMLLDEGAQVGSTNARKFEMGQFGSSTEWKKN